MRQPTDPFVAWPVVPPEAAEFMLPELDRAAEEVISAIQREVPEYARPHDDSYTSTVRRAVRHALHQFAQQIADPATPREGTAQLFGDIGRIEAAEGRSLEPLQTALRLGARVSWRRLYQAAGQSSLDTDVLARIGEAIFLYLDELAAACAEGFARASAEVGGEMERRRRRLLDLLIADPPVSRQAIADRARAAGWPLPRKVAAVALADRSQDRGGMLPGALPGVLPGALPGVRHGSLPGPLPEMLPALPPEVLIDMTRPDPCALVPDPDGPGRADLIERGLRGWTGALGPAVPLARASSSLRWARQALALTRRGIISPGPGVTRCDEHLSTLLIFSDEDLTAGLARTRLAPLGGLRPAQQDTLAETLLAWLQNAGNARETARHLHVHPQTVRYRVRQLHGLFGEVLLEPDVRFDLEIALRARRLLGGATVRPVRNLPPGQAAVAGAGGGGGGGGAGQSP